MVSLNGRGPSLTVDGIVVEDGRLLLVKRGRPPYEGHHALPGGFVDIGETVEDAVVRELREETGLETEVDHLLGVYSDPGRDPRGHTVSVVFVMRKVGGELVAGDDAADAAWFSLSDLPPLAFDHASIVTDFNSGMDYVNE